MQEGYVKLYRKLTTEAVWSDPLKLRLWLQCLMKAAYKDKEVMIGNQLIKLRVGQFVTGRESLSKEFNRDLQNKDQVSDKTLWRWLKVLETTGLLTINSTNKYSIVTVKNENLDFAFGHQLSNESTTPVQQMTTKKNVKNYKKNNNNRFNSANDLLDSFMEEE